MLFDYIGRCTQNGINLGMTCQTDIQEYGNGTDNQHCRKKEQSRTNPRSDLVANPLIER